VIPNGNGLMSPTPFNPMKQMFSRARMIIGSMIEKNDNFADITFA
jgi:hypothetical protein